MDPRRLALVIAGCQPAWSSRSVDAEAVAARLVDVARTLRASGAHVVAVRHGAPVVRACGLPPRPGTQLWEAMPALAAVADEVVDASGVDGFFSSRLDAVLRAHGIDHLVFGGFGAEAAVDSTLRSANDRGYECLTLIDALAPFDRSLGEHALSSITMSGGIFGAIATSDALLASFPCLPAGFGPSSGAASGSAASVLETL